MPAPHPSWAPNDVFINVPFDRQREKVFLGLVAGLASLGLTPRSVLEIAPNTSRLDRLVALIGTCAYSLHDLSRVETSVAAGHRVPRFNMPFELGLAVAVAQINPGHQWRVLETVPHRLAKSLSDLGGFDPTIYGGTLDGLFNALLNAFSHLPEPPLDDVGRMFKVYKQLRSFREASLPTDIFGPAPFKKLVLAAFRIVKAEENSGTDK